MQRRRAAVMTKRPEERRRPMINLRRRGILTFQTSGSGIARMPASVLQVTRSQRFVELE